MILSIEGMEKWEFIQRDLGSAHGSVTLALPS